MQRLLSRKHSPENGLSGAGMGEELPFGHCGLRIDLIAADICNDAARVRCRTSVVWISFKKLDEGRQDSRHLPHGSADGNRFRTVCTVECSYETVQARHPLAGVSGGEALEGCTGIAVLLPRPHRFAELGIATLVACGRFRSRSPL